MIPILPIILGNKTNEVTTDTINRRRREEIKNKEIKKTKTSTNGVTLPKTPYPEIDIEDPFLKTSMELLKDMEEELNEDYDPNIELEERILDMETFLVDTYANQMSLVQLLINKGMISSGEYLEYKKLIKKQEDINALYSDIQTRRKILNERKEI